MALGHQTGQMNLPAVTVVVPALNAETWIADSLSSILAQSFPKDAIEIVVVDDGSVDRTVATAESVLGRSGFAYTIIHNPSPMGPSAARNRGWRSGRGDWVQFLDADDRLDPSKIGAQAETASAARSEVAAFYSPWAKLVLREGRWETLSPFVEPDTGDDPLLGLLRADNFMQLGCLLFSRKWLERVNGFDESIRFIEDVDLLLRLIISGGVLRPVAASKPLSWYRQHPTSLSKSDDSRFADGCVRNARLVERHWREGHTLTAPRVSALAGIYYMGAHFFCDRDPNSFDVLVRDIYRLDPQFVPEGPPALRILTKLLGYSRAERCVVQFRRLKRTIRPQAEA